MPEPDTGEKKKSFVPFYESSAQIYMSLKLSKDGDSRKEDTDILKGMYGEDERIRDIGWKVRRKVFGGKSSNDSGSTGPE